MKKLYFLTVLLVAIFLLVSCGGSKKQTNTINTPAPESQEQTGIPNQNNNLFEKIVFVISDEEITVESEEEMAELWEQVKTFCTNGGGIDIEVHGAGNTNDDLKAGMAAKGIVYQTSLEADSLREFGVGMIDSAQFDGIDATFWKSVLSYKDITLVKLKAIEATDDGEFPAYFVGVRDGKNLVQVHNRTEFASWLKTLVARCEEGKAYGGIGVNMVGFEVSSSELSGIPYSHLSYGRGTTATLLGISSEVVAAMDSKLIVDLLVLCQHFERVEFYLVKDAANPVMAN